MIKLKAKLDLFKVRDEATMENIVLFEFQTGDPNIDPLYPDTAVWENLTNNVAKGTSTIDSSKNEIKERKSLRSSTKEKGHRSSPNDREESAHLVSAVPGAASTPSVSINSDSNVISQMQMLEAILERAKRPYHWFPWREDEYNFRDDDQYKKAKALGLETLFEMFKTTHDYYLGSMNWSAERGRSPSDIRLRFVRDIDLPSSHPIPNSEQEPQQTKDNLSGRYDQRPKIDPSMIIANIQYLETRSAEDLLALDPTLRNGFVSTLVSEVPHMLHEHNWVLLLVITLETEEAFEKELNKCSIKVEKG